MKDNLEDTRALNELESLAKDEDQTMVFDPIVEDETETQEELYNDLVSQEDTIEFKEEKEEQQEDNKEEKEEEVKKDSLFKRIKNKWSTFSKKKKIIIIVSSIIVLLLIIGLIVFIVKKNSNKGTQTGDEIVIEKDNYIYQNGKLLLQSDGTTIGEYECNNKDDKLCYVAYLNNSEDDLDSGSNVYENGDIVKSRAPIYLKKYAFIVDQSDSSSDIIFLYDMEDKIVLNEYSKVKAYSTSNNYVVLANKNSEYGLYELTESSVKEKIEPKYTYMALLKGEADKVIAKQSDGSVLLSLEGSTLTSKIPGDIVNYNDALVVAKNYGKYSLYDYQAKEYTKDVDYIRIINNDYYAVVTSKMLNIKDKDNYSYNIDGYELSSDKYSPVNIYDKDNKKIKTEEAFSAELNGDILNITIDNNTILLNMIDGKYSKNLKYYSYLDGKLYFFSDEAKQNLIGSYTCNNKNNITEDDFNLNSCTIASDSVFEDNYVSIAKKRESLISLYNNRYAFIYDSPALANESNIEIKFYDLIDKKVLGTYAQVDSNTNSNNKTFNLVSASGLDIIAKKKDGKYGIITINTNKASGDFESNWDYDSIERFGKYYLVKKNKKWYIIYGKNDTSFEFKDKIMDINEDYVVLKDDDDNVKIYKNEENAKAINDDAYNYIVLYKDVYAAVDGKNKLWVFKYDDKKALNSKGIHLDGKVYYGEDVENYPFEISVNAAKTEVKVRVYNGKKYEDSDTLSLTGNNIGED